MTSIIKLKLGQFLLCDSMKPADPKDIINAIQKEAIYIWGSRHWLADLTHRYCEVEGEFTGTTPSPPHRRSTIGRIFETGKTTIQTLQWLAICVNAKVQLVAIVGNELKVFEDIIDGIKQVAIARWGEDWLAELICRYCEIEGQMRGKTPLPRQRRSSLERALKEGTTLETATWLAAAVGAEIQMAVQRVEVRKF